MIKLMGFTVLLILFLRIVAVSSGVESCSPVLDAARTKTGNLTCDAIKSFAQCVLNGISNGDATLSAKERIAEMEALSKRIGKVSPELGNITCVTDYQTKIKELADEMAKKLIPVGTKVGKIISDANMGLCMGKMALNMRSGCYAANGTVKCAMRASGFTNLEMVTEENIAAVKKQMEEKFAFIRIKCNLDYAAIAEEIRREDSGPKLSVTDMAKCVSKSALEMYSACDAVKKAATCAMTASGLTNPEKATAESTAALKRQVDEKLALIGIKCDVDYPVLASGMGHDNNVATQVRRSPLHLTGIAALTIASTFVRP